jgi:hypothetical protein
LVKTTMGQLIHDPVIGQRYRFSQEGEVLRVEVFADPGSKLPEHLHPQLEERLSRRRVAAVHERTGTSPWSR